MRNVALASDNVPMTNRPFVEIVAVNRRFVGVDLCEGGTQLPSSLTPDHDEFPVPLEPGVPFLSYARESTQPHAILLEPDCVVTIGKTDLAEEVGEVHVSVSSKFAGFFGTGAVVDVDHESAIGTEHSIALTENVPERGDGGRPAKLSLKEIRTAMGETYKPIMTVEEAAALSRLAVKTLQKKVSEGCFKQSVKRGRPLLFWTDRFVQELMR